jgi:hypothetical protein
MTKRKHVINSHKNHQAWLYSLVYASRFSSLLILFLFTSFFIQPIHRALASEDVVIPVPEPEVIVANEVLMQTEVPPLPQESPPEDVVSSGDVLTESTTPVAGDLLVPDSNLEEETQTIDSANEVEDSKVYAGETQDDDSIDTPSESIVDELSAEDGVTKDSVSDDELVTLDDVVGSSTQTISESQFLITDENFYQFSKQSCIAVGSGAFHCTRNSQDEVNAQSIAYAAIGESGNTEIFLKTSRGTDKQLTNNSFEDSSPFYDAQSMRVVWQRLIDGRQQIILYDIRKNEEVQLTFSRTNNMEPKVSGAGIVWQAWDGADWEIMYFDGTYTDQITQNESNDVAPVIKDNYILWSVLGESEQQARVYSLDSKETISIIGHEGGSIENPRFVLVYDTKFDNGDVVTQGFDPVTGLSAPISAQPVPIPVDIPSSDSTGETRALIQNKPSQKDDIEILEIDSGPGLDTNPATSTDDGTLDLLTPTIASSTDSVNAIDLPNFELTEYDLVVPFTTTTESSTQ